MSFRSAFAAASLLGWWLGASPLLGQNESLSKPTCVLSTSDERALVAAREAIWRAWFANDTAALRQLLPPASAAGEKSGWQDRAAILAGAQEFATRGAKLVHLSFSETHTCRHGAVAVMQSNYVYRLDSRGTITTGRGRATEVFVLQGGRWVNPFWFLDSER